MQKLVDVQFPAEAVDDGDVFERVFQLDNDEVQSLLVMELRTEGPTRASTVSVLWFIFLWQVSEYLNNT
jgi:hypothetical protein